MFKFKHQHNNNPKPIIQIQPQNSSTNHQTIPSMSHSTKQSLTEIQINRQITFIYSHLIKLGYPKIVQIGLTKVEEMEEYLKGYFQCTPARMQLVEWLVAVVMPEYREMQWYVGEKDHVVRLMRCLWRVGVMPVNKHTKNLDYKKYLQATLGYENAVSLISNLVQLAYQTILTKKSKPDLSFGQFSHQLIDNFTQLINENYDVYGITFPSKFINVNQMNQGELVEDNDERNEEYMSEFQRQYEQFYAEKMVKLLEQQDELFDKIYARKGKQGMKQQRNGQMSTNQHNELQKFVDQLSKYGRQYNQKYTALVDKIDELLSSPQTTSRLIPYYLQQKQQQVSQQCKPSVRESVENRSIRISPEFCRKYMNYKKLLKQIKYPKDDQQFMDKRVKLMQKIQQINQEICL